MRCTFFPIKQSGRSKNKSTKAKTRDHSSVFILLYYPWKEIFVLFQRLLHVSVNCWYDHQVCSGNIFKELVDMHCKKSTTDFDLFFDADKLNVKYWLTSLCLE